MDKKIQVAGALTNKNAGGNCTHPTFMLNPQYHLKIHPDASGKQTPQKASVRLRLKGARETALNVTVAWSPGERVLE